MLVIIVHVSGHVLFVKKCMYIYTLLNHYVALENQLIDANGTCDARMKLKDGKSNEISFPEFPSTPRRRLFRFHVVRWSTTIRDSVRPEARSHAPAPGHLETGESRESSVVMGDQLQPHSDMFCRSVSVVITRYDWLWILFSVFLSIMCKYWQVFW